MKTTKITPRIQSSLNSWNKDKLLQVHIELRLFKLRQTFESKIIPLSIIFTVGLKKNTTKYLSDYGYSNFGLTKTTTDVFHSKPCQKWS